MSVPAEGSSTQLQAGGRLRSRTSGAEFIVVRKPDQDVEVNSGGAPLVDAGAEVMPKDPEPGLDGPVLLGKRYLDPDSGLEILCTKGGIGTLTCDGRVMPIKDAKPLPSSD